MIVNDMNMPGILALKIISTLREIPFLSKPYNYAMIPIIYLACDLLFSLSCPVIISSLEKFSLWFHP